MRKTTKFIATLFTAIALTSLSNATTWLSDNEKKAARMAAQLKGDYTITSGSMSFHATWLRSEGECDIVHVDKYYNYSRTKATNISKDVMVCPDKISVITRTPYDKPLQNKQVYAEVKRVARLAQKMGRATGEVNQYIIEAFPVRDFKKCNVEVKIFNKNTLTLVYRTIVNGCQ